MAETSRPAAASERMAASRPEPGPFTQISTFLTPASKASLAAASAASWAAKGVDFLEPLKPLRPADEAHTTAPEGSVMVTMVLLKEALIWATQIPSIRRCLF